MSHVVGRDSSAIKFDRVEIAFILALHYWMNPLPDEGEDDFVCLRSCPGRVACERQEEEEEEEVKVYNKTVYQKFTIVRFRRSTF